MMEGSYGVVLAKDSRQGRNPDDAANLKKNQQPWKRMAIDSARPVGVGDL
jgi:hypothetical protein